MSYQMKIMKLYVRWTRGYCRQQTIGYIISQIMIEILRMLKESVSDKTVLYAIQNTADMTFTVMEENGANIYIAFISFDV